MNKLFWVFFLFSIPSYSFGQFEDEIPPLYLEIVLPQNKPKVKRINAYVYQYKNSQLIKSDLVRISNLNKVGKEIERIFLNGQGAEERKVIFEFDSLGRLISKKHFNAKRIGTQFYAYNYVKGTLIGTERIFSLPDSQLNKSIVRKYDRQGRMISEQIFAGDTLMRNRNQVQLIEYKKSGEMASQDFLDASGLIYQSFWYDYDEHGQETDFMSLDREGKLLAQRRTNYTEAGKEEFSFLGDEMVPIKVIHSYLNLGNGIKEEEKSFYRLDKLYEKEVFRYDPQEKILLSQKTRINEAYELGTFTERIEYIYNTLGLISEKLYFINTKLQKRYLFLYEYH